MAAYGYKVALLFACALNITGQLYNYLAYYMAVFTHNTVAILANIAARQLRSTSAGYTMGPGIAENNAWRAPLPITKIIISWKIRFEYSIYAL